MSDKAPRESFNQFFDFLKQVDKDYLSEQRFVTEADDIAEGQHMLLHLVKAGIDVWVDNDASRPRFAPLQSGVLKWGGEGPDNPTFCAPLDNRHRYVIRGKMGKEVYISFTVYTGKEEGDWNDGVICAMNHTEFSTDADGNFEIFIEREPKAGELHTEAGKPCCVVARHYFEETTTALAIPELRCEIDIECLNDPGFPRPIKPQALSEKLRAAQVFITGQTLDRPMPGEAEPPSWFSMQPNVLPTPEKFVPSEGGGAGAIDNTYCAGLVLLQADEALIVTGRWPNCVYGNVCYWNRYQQNTDYRYRNGSLNRNQMRVNDDGSFTFVVAHNDPGISNWLDTEGHMMGNIYFRFLMTEGELVQPDCQVVKFDQLSHILGAIDR